MTTTQQPEALLFANDRPYSIDDDLYHWARYAQIWILRLHDRVVELESQLEAIGAGGVESLRKKGNA